MRRASSSARRFCWLPTRAPATRTSRSASAWAGLPCTGPSAASWWHGCVRISPKNAATLYALVKQNGLENTQVVVTGVSPGGEYNVARGQTSPRGGFFGRSFGVPYYNGSQGYYRSPWTYSPW